MTFVSKSAAVVAMVGLAGAMASAFAADLPPSSTMMAEVPPAQSLVPDSGVLLGAGASYNRVGFDDQSIYATGLSNVYENGVLVANGAATGGTGVGVDSDDTVAPLVQLGYFQHFPESDWLWGAKFSYAYLGASSSADNLLVPQSGAFNSSNGASFAGNLYVRSYEVQIEHQLALLPFIGRSFEKGFIYAGGGPTLSYVTSGMNGVIGFADINGVHQDITGRPTNFSSSEWVFGGAATVGATYFLSRDWFIDVNYTYAVTRKTSERFAATFDNPSRGYTYTGVGFGTYAGSTETQSIGISINRVF